MSAAPNPITYDVVGPLVVATKDESSGVFVTLRCPVTGVEVLSDGPWPDEGLAGRTAGQVKRGLLSSVRNSLARTVGSAIGSHTGSPVASIGAEASAQIIYGAGNQQAYREHHSDKDRRAATVSAFNRVAWRFAWDDHTSRFVAAESPTVQQSEFDRLVGANPIANAFDREVTTRLIGSLIASDGAVTDDERASFAALFQGVSLDQVVAARAPGRVDFEETTGAGSPTVRAGPADEPVDAVTERRDCRICG